MGIERESLEEKETKKARGERGRESNREQIAEEQAESRWRVKQNNEGRGRDKTKRSENKTE